MQATQPVSVYKAWNSRQGLLLRQLLEDEGIEARVASYAIEFVAGEVPYQMASCPVLVHASDWERATVVVDQFEATLCGDEFPFRAALASFCYHCGEAICNKAASCPNCGLDLDWSADEAVAPARVSLGRLMMIVVLIMIG